MGGAMYLSLKKCPVCRMSHHNLLFMPPTEKEMCANSRYSGRALCPTKAEEEMYVWVCICYDTTGKLCYQYS